MYSQTRAAKRRRRRPGDPPAGLQVDLPRRPLGLLAEIQVLWEESAPELPTLTARAGWSLAAAFLLVHVVALVWLSPLPLQDFPNHLARVLVLSDLIFQHGAHFGSQFQYRFLAIPYVLGDLVLAAATALLGLAGAAALWSVLVFLSLPCALLFYLRTTRIASEAQALFLILSIYLSTDWFFLVGFLEFRLGIAVALVALAVAERVRRRPTYALFTIYAGVLLLGYLTHLTTLVFTTAILGVSALLRLSRRTSTLRTEAWLLLPCLILLLWHFGWTAAYREPDDLVENPYLWGTIYQKLIGLDGEFARFAMRSDAIMMGALALALALQVGRVRLRDFNDPVVIEMLTVAATMTALYFVLPVGYAEAYYVDVRALPLAALFSILACLSLPVRTRQGGSTWAVWVAALLVGANFAYLIKHLSVHSRWLAQYRMIIAAIPRGASVLPIYTHGRDGKVEPLLHAYSFAAIDRGDIVPYLQTGDTGNPQKYLRYLHRPYAPDETWYGNVPASPVDWKAVACEYDYILITRPFERARLPLPVKTVIENASGSLLALAPAAPCGSRQTHVSNLRR